MTHLSHKEKIVAALLPLSCLAMFFSLAVHMRLSLGAWPETIGNHGFSDALNAHAKVQYWWLETVARASVLLWPPAMLLSLIIPSARRFIPYLIVYAVATLLCCFLMMALAPPAFRYWWID